MAYVGGLLALALAVSTFPRMVVPAVWFPLLLECLRVGGLSHIFDAAFFVNTLATYFVNTLLLLGFLWWVYGFQVIADSIWSSLPPPRADRPTLILGESGGGYAHMLCVPSLLGRSGGFTRCRSQRLCFKRINLVVPCSELSILPTVMWCVLQLVMTGFSCLKYQLLVLWMTLILHEISGVGIQQGSPAFEESPQLSTYQQSTIRQGLFGAVDTCLRRFVNSVQGGWTDLCASSKLGG